MSHGSKPALTRRGEGGGRVKRMGGSAGFSTGPTDLQRENRKTKTINPLELKKRSFPTQGNSGDLWNRLPSIRGRGEMQERGKRKISGQQRKNQKNRCRPGGQPVARSATKMLSLVNPHEKNSSVRQRRLRRTTYIKRPKNSGAYNI